MYLFESSLLVYISIFYDLFLKENCKKLKLIVLNDSYDEC